MSFSLFLALLLVFSCHRPVAFGSGTSRDQPGVGSAGRSFKSTFATTFNKSSDEVGAAAKDRNVYRLRTADLASNPLLSLLHETTRLSAGLSGRHVTRTLCMINV